MYNEPDSAVSEIRVRKGRRCYGMGLGVILLDEEYPGFPGDMRNASAHGFPIQYEIAEGVTSEALIFTQDKSHCLESIKKSARKLEFMGCRAIAGECGYFAYFQKEIAGYVEVPVFMSSLLQVGWAQQLVGPQKTVGVLVAFEKHFTSAHFDAVYVAPDSNYVVSGAIESGTCPELFAMCGSENLDERRANYRQMEKEFIQAAQNFRQNHPDMAALVLECSAMQPFARAIQRVLDIPVFSWGTLLDYAYSVVAHREYYGHV